MVANFYPDGTLPFLGQVEMLWPNKAAVGARSVTYSMLVNAGRVLSLEKCSTRTVSYSEGCPGIVVGEIFPIPGWPGSKVEKIVQISNGVFLVDTESGSRYTIVT